MSEQDVSGWSSLVNAAQKEAEEYESSTGSMEDGPKLVFIGAGTHDVRFYVDRTKKTVRLIRRIVYHMNSKKRVKCEGDNCQVCKFVETAKAQGLKDAWKYGPRESGLAFGVVYKSTDASKYMVKDSPVVMVLHARMVYEINKMISTYGVENSMKLFEANPSLVIKISHTGGAGGNTNVAPIPFESEKKLLPSYEKFPDLDAVYIPSGPPSDKDVSEFKQLVQARLRETLSLTEPPQNSPPVAPQAPMAGSMNNGPSVVPPSPGAPTFTQQSASLGIAGIVGPRPLKSGGSLPKDAPQCYGAKPKDVNHVCQLCPHEMLCIKETLLTASLV